MTPSPQPEYRTIPLTKGQVAIVDAADYEWLSRHNWAVQHDSRHGRGTYYAMRHGRTPDGRKVKIWMHRQILGLAPGDPRQGDHREPSQTLDNRHSNLRIATRKEQARNRRLRRDNVCGFKAVTYDPKRKKYRAKISVEGKTTNLPRRDTPQEAHALYCEAARKAYGEFARFQ